MKRATSMKNIDLRPALFIAALFAVAAPVGAEEYYLAAKPFTKVMPDGDVIPMWGYVEDPGGSCYLAATATATLACVDGLPDPQLPGPRLVVSATDLTIYLSNGLVEPTSVVMTGQELPISSGLGPTWDDGSTGSRGGNLTKKVRSFGSEATPGGGRESYSWTAGGSNPLRVGTYIMYSGTHPQKQVYMGLYGAVTRDAVVADLTPGTGSLAAEVYPGVAYEDEVVLFYSEIDPVLNSSIACMPTGVTCPPGIEPYTTSINYHPTWFLVNGEPYVEGVTPDIFAGSSLEDTTLVRFLSTAGMTHVPVLQGMYMMIHAEDGVPYAWTNTTDNSQGPAPREQYSVQLPPLKTKDAILHALFEDDSRFAIYDGNGYMTNPTDPEDVGDADDVGGMLRFLLVAADGDEDGVADAEDNCPVSFNTSQIDSEGDGFGDACDNCIAVANSDQRNTDGDSFGNICDGDLNNDNVVNLSDFSMFRAVFGQSSTPQTPLTPAAENADFNGDGVVNLSDFSLFRSMFGGSPGP